mmetsp:Transcript_74129/g.167956  ORF Transcript_74129/g.167956 Transcript_74129/m.167956 type:complete len:149 (-) Transcript_74129:122-568(-)|eukprot:CAMPEP_0197897636 /NCGR_PEP_ID=MMETSP1439-20131203/42292_1 /TAXON_ID=66791 /ORGANISM="Gonyaulax spinifera, Strain CCMP409" /LENGTH=148 /DNA_ID=CAMNT_0043518277 /DNA_START=61 /DNA_END=507 /DNA_ORIENTATION=+
MAPKVKKKVISKNKRRKAQKASIKLAGSKVPLRAPRREDAKKRGKRRRDLVAHLVGIAKQAAVSSPAETPEQIKQRHAAEWKEMKAKVAKLKKEKKKLPRQGSKDKKVEVKQQIRMFLSEMQVKHEAERKAVGLDAPPAEDADGMSED